MNVKEALYDLYREFLRVDKSISEVEDALGEELILKIDESFEIFNEMYGKLHNIILKYLKDTNISIDEISNIKVGFLKSEALSWIGIAEWYRDFLNQKMKSMKFRLAIIGNVKKIKKEGDIYLIKSEEHYQTGNFIEATNKAKEAYKKYEKADEELNLTSEKRWKGLVSNIISAIVGGIIVLIISRWL